MSRTVLYRESSSTNAKVYIISQSGEVKEITLTNHTVIGRQSTSSSVDIGLNSPIISRTHGEIVFSNDKYYYRDLDSTNGTYVNDILYGKATNNIAKLKNGDVIRFDIVDNGEHHRDAIALIFSTDNHANSQWKSQELDTDMAEINIGRKKARDKDIAIENNMVSMNHATFFNTDNGWAIYDHNSTNGVFLNNNKITKPLYLKSMDVVRIVNMHFMFLGNKIIYQQFKQEVRASVVKEPVNNDDQLIIQITERSVWQKFKKLTLLKNINMSIKKGEMVLILGGSGAGKTTFMNAVMGYEKAEGKIIHGDTDIYTEYELMKYEIGFVPQQDLLRSNDTVYDTLNNAADMKLPKNISMEKKTKRIDEILELLGLQREADSLVVKLSGGQRKRLSIAIEFISNPSLFFLDEPDSGLDGIMAKSLMNNLRQIANIGKIVMVITHSPDRVAELFDKVIVLAKSVKDNCGHLAFFGSTNDAYDFFEADTLEGIVKRINRPDEGGDGMSDFYIDKYNSAIGGGYDE